MNKIENPVFRIIKTFPSSLGTIDFFIVVYEKGKFISWNSKIENEIAENIYEKGVYKDVYVIHSSSSRGEKINPINSNIIFSQNRTNCDSILIFHILAVKFINKDVILRTGFHDLKSGINKTIYDWETMKNISNGYQEIIINKERFYNLYNEQN